MKISSLKLNQSAEIRYNFEEKFKKIYDEKSIKEELDRSLSKIDLGREMAYLAIISESSDLVLAKIAFNSLKQKLISTPYDDIINSFINMMDEDVEILQLIIFKSYLSLLSSGETECKIFQAINRCKTHLLKKIQHTLIEVNIDQNAFIEVLKAENQEEDKNLNYVSLAAQYEDIIKNQPIKACQHRIFNNPYIITVLSVYFSSSDDEYDKKCHEYLMNVLKYGSKNSQKRLFDLSLIIEILFYIDFPEMDNKNINYLVEALIKAKKTPIDGEIILRHIISTKMAMAFFKLSCESQDLISFTFSTHTAVLKTSLPLTVMEASIPTNWNSIEYVSAIIHLFETNRAEIVKMIKKSMQTFSDIILLGVLQHPRFRVDGIYSEVIQILVDFYIQNDKSSAEMLKYLFNHEQYSDQFKKIILKSLRRYFNEGASDRDQRVSRIFDLAQNLKAIGKLLNSKDLNYVIELAFEASKRNYVQIDKWMAEKFTQCKESFLKFLLDYLEKNWRVFSYDTYHHISTPEQWNQRFVILESTLNFIQNYDKMLGPESVEKFRELSEKIRAHFVQKGSTAEVPGEPDILYLRTIFSFLTHNVNYLDSLQNRYNKIKCLLMEVCLKHESGEGHQVPNFLKSYVLDLDNLEHIDLYQFSTAMLLIFLLCQSDVIQLGELKLLIEKLLFKYPNPSKYYYSALSLITLTIDIIKYDRKFCKKLYYSYVFMEFPAMLKLQITEVIYPKRFINVWLNINHLKDGHYYYAKSGDFIKTMTEKIPDLVRFQHYSNEMSFYQKLRARGTVAGNIKYDDKNFLHNHKNEVMKFLEELKDNIPVEKLLDLSANLENNGYKILATCLTRHFVPLYFDRHSLYTDLIKKIDDVKFYKNIKIETYFVIKEFLSDLSLNEERSPTNLKIYGLWIGRITIGADIPVTYEHINIKELILEAYLRDQQKLTAMLLFLENFMSFVRVSTILKTYNPFLIGILSILAEIYLKEKTKAENRHLIKSICRTVGVSIKGICPSAYLQDGKNLLETLKIIGLDLTTINSIGSNNLSKMELRYLQAFERLFLKKFGDYFDSTIIPIDYSIIIIKIIIKVLSKTSIFMASRLCNSRIIFAIASFGNKNVTQIKSEEPKNKHALMKKLLHILVSNIDDVKKTLKKFLIKLINDNIYKETTKEYVYRTTNKIIDENDEKLLRSMTKSIYEYIFQNEGYKKFNLQISRNKTVDNLKLLAGKNNENYFTLLITFNEFYPDLECRCLLDNVSCMKKSEISIFEKILQSSSDRIVVSSMRTSSITYDFYALINSITFHKDLTKTYDLLLIAVDTVIEETLLTGKDHSASNCDVAIHLITSLTRFRGFHNIVVKIITSHLLSKPESTKYDYAVLSRFLRAELLDFSFFDRDIAVNLIFSNESFLLYTTFLIQKLRTKFPKSVNSLNLINVSKVLMLKIQGFDIYLSLSSKTDDNQINEIIIDEFLINYNAGQDKIGHNDHFYNLFRIKSIISHIVINSTKEQEDLVEWILQKNSDLFITKDEHINVMKQFLIILFLYILDYYQRGIFTAELLLSYLIPSYCNILIRFLRHLVSGITQSLQINLIFTDIILYIKSTTFSFVTFNADNKFTFTFSAFVKNLINELNSIKDLDTVTKDKWLIIILELLHSTRPKIYPEFTCNWMILATNIKFIQCCTNKMEYGLLAKYYSIIIVDYLEFIHPLLHAKNINQNTSIQKLLEHFIVFISCLHINCTKLLASHSHYLLYYLSPKYYSHWDHYVASELEDLSQPGIQEDTAKNTRKILKQLFRNSRDFIEYSFAQHVLKLLDSDNTEETLKNIISHFKEGFNFRELRASTYKMVFLYEFIKNLFILEQSYRENKPEHEIRQSSPTLKILLFLVESLNHSGKSLLFSLFVNNILSCHRHVKLLVNILISIYKNTKCFRVQKVIKIVIVKHANDLKSLSNDTKKRLKLFNAIFRFRLRITDVINNHANRLWRMVKRRIGLD